MSTMQRDGALEEVYNMLQNAKKPLRNLLLFGGTTEGRELAVALVRNGLNVRVCVATHVGANQLPIGMPGLEVTCGRLDADTMVKLMQNKYGAVIDATHPYAVEVSANVRLASKMANLSYVRIIRPSIDCSDCVMASTTAEACHKIPDDGKNVLATTGNKEILDYTSIQNFKQRVYARVLPDDASIKSCLAVGLPKNHIIGEKGPFSLEHNLETIKKFDIKHMITKESGAAGGFLEKLDAARQCGVNIIVVKRPQDEDGILPQDLISILSDLTPKISEER